MSIKLLWSHGYKNDLDISKTSIYRKPRYPYSENPVVSVDAEGLPLSYFNDDSWDYRLVEGGTNFTWKGGNNLFVSDDNLFFVKSIVLASIYDRRISKGKI